MLNATVVNTSTLNANEISTGTLHADTISTNTLTANLISSTEVTVGSTLKVFGDITAVNVTASDKIESYFNNSQYLTSAQALLPEIAGSNAFFYNVTSERNFLSSIVTNNINLDNNFLDTGGAGIGAVLLLNGYPIATVSTSISSPQQWSYFPALSTVYMNNNNLYDVGDLSANTIISQTISAFDANVDNDLFVNQKIFANQSEFQEILTSDLTATTLQATLGSISSLRVSTLTTNSVVIPTGTFTNLTATNINTTNITAVAGNIADIGATTINVNQLNATNATVSGTLTQNEVRGVNGFINEEAANRIRIRVQGSSDVFSSPELDLEAGGGNRGIVNVIANPGYGGIQGEVNIKAKGGSAVGYATGGLLNLTAERGTSVLGTASYSRVGIAADSITSYAGGPSPFSGVYGYNFIYGLLGVNLVAGTPPVLPNVAGTVYLYGLNPLGTGSSGGVRVQNGMSVDVLYPYPQGFIAPEYDLIIRGNPAGQKVTLSNVRYIFGDGTIATGFADLLTDNLSATNLNGTNIYGNQITTPTLNADVGNISTLNSQNSQITRLFNVSTINGFTIDQLVSTVTPPQFTSTTSTFQQLFTSSLQAVNISSITANVTQISGLSTLNGYTVEQLISSVSPLVYFSTVSSFQQLATSSFRVSSITGTANNLNILTPQLLLNGTPASQVLQLSTTQQLFTSSLTASNISSSVIQVSSINGYNLNDLANQPQVSTFLELFASTGIIYNASNLVLNVSSINGFNTNQFLAAPYVSTLSSFQEVFTSTLQANNISTRTVVAQTANVQQLLASTLNGFTTAQFLAVPYVSSISTFQQLFTSSLVANNISSGVIQVSSINGFNLAQLVSSVSPPTPAPSTFQQLFTSSLSGSNANLSLFASNISLIAASNITNTATSNISLTATNNLSFNASNTAALYTTNTAPTPPSQGIVILGQGNTNIQSQADTNITAANNILVNAGQITKVQGLYTEVNASLQIQLNGSNEISATSSNIRLNGALFINGSPYVAGTSNYTNLTTDTLFVNTLSNTSGLLNVRGTNILVSSYTTQIGAVQNVELQANNEIFLQPSRSLQVLTSNVVLTANVGVTKNLNAPAITGLSSINGLPYTSGGGTTVSTFQQLFTSSLQTNTINGAAYPPPATQQVSTFQQLFTSSFQTNTINGAAYPPPQAQQVSTFQQLFTSSFQTNTINGAAYPPPQAQQVSTFQQLFTSSFQTSTINGAAYPPPQAQQVSTFQQLFTSSFVTNTINGAAYPPPQAQQVSTFQQLFTSSFQTNTINGAAYPPPQAQQISTFQQLFTSSFVTNTINGAAYPPAQPQQISTFREVFTSSLTASTITSKDNLYLTAPLEMAMFSPTGSYIGVDNTGLIQLEADNGTSGTLQMNAKGVININSGTVSGGSLIQLTTDAAGNIFFNTPSTICAGDITAATFNGLPLPTGGGGTTVSTFQQLFTSSFTTNTINGSNYPPPSSWVGTATSDLNMNTYSISNLNQLSGSNMSTYASGTLGFYSSNDMTIASGGQVDFQANGGELYITGTGGTFLQTGIDFTFSNPGVTYQYTSNIYRQLFPGTQIKQPVIQHGRVSAARAATGSNTVSMPFSYYDTNYTVQITGAMNGVDINNTYQPLFFVQVDSGTDFTVHWTGGSPDNDVPFFWTAFGTYEIPV